MNTFYRWPTWMWANGEMVALTDWLQQHNLNRKAHIGFYGLDVYSLWGGPHSWNIRDRHMADTLERLLHFHGADSKAIILLIMDKWTDDWFLEQPIGHRAVDRTSALHPLHIATGGHKVPETFPFGM